MNVHFEIDATGRVTKTASKGSDLKDEDVVECVLARFEDMSLTQLEGGDTVKVVYPVVFSAN